MVDTLYSAFSIGVPLVLLTTLLSSFVVRQTPPSLQPQSSTIEVDSHLGPILKISPPPRRSILLWLLFLLGFTSVLQGVLLVVPAVINQSWSEGWMEGSFYVVMGALIWSGAAVRAEWEMSLGFGGTRRVWIRALAVLGLVGEGLMGSLMLWNVVHSSPQIVGSPPLVTIFAFTLNLLRLLLLVTLNLTVFLPLPAQSVPSSATSSTDTLLGPSSVPNAAYGTFHSASSATVTPPTQPDGKNPAGPGGDDRPQTWGALFKRLRALSPHLWPKTNFRLQVFSFLCIFIIVLGRIVNAGTPLAFGNLIDDLTNSTSPWKDFIIYISLRFSSGSGGILVVLQSMLWAPVMQSADFKMSTLCFDHLLNLSLAWHTKKKTGEVLRILDRGSALNNLFQLILFNILPVFFDISFALGIFYWKFGGALAFVILVVMAAYVVVSVMMTGWRTKIRRQMNERDTLTRGIVADVLMGWETVKYFGAEERENSRYRSAIAEYQVLEFKVVGSLNLLNLTQNAIISTGLLLGSLMVANRVVNGDASPALFVVFISYLAQLSGPLNNLGGIYRQLNQTCVDSEKLLKLLDEDLDVRDQPGAKDLVVTDGVVEFEDVRFAYDTRLEALKGISFKIPKGSSVALVGESGSGKSTVLRLLYRFYEITSGTIRIDGQDISKVTQSSLRRAIGVVPQDSVLFNESIKYNIAYGRENATDEEIEEVAKNAQLHSRILTFPDGYETKVGERGVRLSGGEKQRVSLARTMLKSPPILLLDEATSALDTNTEREIQTSLNLLLQNRTSLSIAHRLSTIVNADIILVLSNGEIVESGSHAELVEKKGVFAELWKKQITSEAEQLAATALLVDVSDPASSASSASKKLLPY
ncbi:hypothetical protein BDY24DRAFT_384154 [Mrakia frigida]|uniref:ABCB family ABC transporter ATP-binding protein/permease n=1 Tax=Mrakia frigida TaxID=29902 RepID=UPI003FCBFDFB